MLLDLVTNNVGVLASRAFSSLELLLSHPEDTMLVIDFLYHPDRTVRVIDNLSVTSKYNHRQTP